MRRTYLVDGGEVNHLAAYVGLVCDFDVELHDRPLLLEVQEAPAQRSADTQRTRAGASGRFIPVRHTHRPDSDRSEPGLATA